MVALPWDTPETTPEAFTVATLTLLLDQVPPAVPLEERLVVFPTHTDKVPEREPALGRGLMVTRAESIAVPQPFVTL